MTARRNHFKKKKVNKVILNENRQGFRLPFSLSSEQGSFDSLYSSVLHPFRMIPGKSGVKCSTLRACGGPLRFELGQWRKCSCCQILHDFILFLNKVKLFPASLSPISTWVQPLRKLELSNL